MLLFDPTVDKQTENCEGVWDQEAAKGSKFAKSFA
jgi:hypothetical protein